MKTRKSPFKICSEHRYREMTNILVTRGNKFISLSKGGWIKIIYQEKTEEGKNVHEEVPDVDISTLAKAQKLLRNTEYGKRAYQH